MTLSADVVRDFKDLFSKAIEWYEDKEKKDGKPEFRLSDENLSDLSEIKSCIKDGREIVRQKRVDLLVSIIDEFERYLKGKETEDDAERSSIDATLKRIEEFRNIPTKFEQRK